MEKKNIIVLLLLWGLFNFPSKIYSPVFAQQATPGEAGEELESCFKYYDYGKVKVYLASDKSSYNPGEKAKISGTINNLNTFPLRDVSLFAQIKRINGSEDFLTDGHFPVDRKTFLQNLNLLSKETINVSFELPIEKNYPKGEYQLQYFIFSKNGFNYAGRNFLEEDVAGVSNFTIESKTEASTYFDPKLLTVNGTSHQIRESISIFPLGKINLSVVLKVNANQNPITANYYFYSYDDNSEDNLVGSGSQELNEQNGYILNAEFTPQTSGAYVFLANIESPVKTMIKYRFAAEGNDPSPLKMNDLGISAFPPKNSSRAYLCFHSATERETPVYTVRLSLIDKDNITVEEKKITAAFDSSVQAISLPMEKIYDKDVFKIRGEMTSDSLPDKTQTAEVEYSCDAFSGSVSDFNMSYDPNNPKSLVIEGTDGCGKVSRTGGVIDSVKISKNGQIIKEDYNTENIQGEYNLGNIPGGEYTVEVKKGDTVKVMSIRITEKKENNLLRYFILLILIAGGGTVYLLLRKKMIKIKKK